jgi:hypothetical protein
MPITSNFMRISVISPILLTHVRLNAPVTRTQADGSLGTFNHSNVLSDLRERGRETVLFLVVSKYMALPRLKSFVAAGDPLLTADQSV